MQRRMGEYRLRGRGRTSSEGRYDSKSMANPCTRARGEARDVSARGTVRGLARSGYPWLSVRGRTSVSAKNVTEIIARSISK